MKQALENLKEIVGILKEIDKSLHSLDSTLKDAMKPVVPYRDPTEWDDLFKTDDDLIAKKPLIDKKK